MPWKDSFPIRPRAGTNGRKRLSRDLRTTDKLGVGRPGPSWASPAPSTRSPPRRPEVSQPQQPTRGRAEGGSGRLFRPGCRRWTQWPNAPHMAATAVPQAQRPRWGAKGHVTVRWQLQKHTLVLLLDFHPVTRSPA